MKRLDGPHSDEIEISLFGPGYGECCLLHIGNNEWIIIDSCINPYTKEPAAIQYLSSIGVDLENDIKAVVATHWHDDHIRGLGKIVKCCSSAEFICSSALLSKEFLTFVHAFAGRPMMSSGVNEFHSIISHLEETRRRYKFAIVDRLIWGKKYSEQLGCEIYSLSPSDSAFKLALMNIAQMLPYETRPKGDAYPIQPNYFAIVLWVKIGDTHILLGSDLENKNDVGWKEIVESSKRPLGLASVFKIPHHGSKNADFPPLWQSWLINQPFAILTPFHLGKVNLPTFQDISRIQQRTENSYLTAIPERRRIKKEKIVDDLVRGATRQISCINSYFGHIRLKKNNMDSESNWQVDLFDSAISLTDYLKRTTQKK